MWTSDTLIVALHRARCKGAMDTPRDQDIEEESRRDTVERAWALLEKSPEYSSVIVEINDGDNEVRKNRTEEAKKRLSEARLEYVLKFLDVHGKAYLRLVTNLESVKALATVMDDFARVTWYQLSNLAPEVIPPTMPFMVLQPAQIQRDRIFERARYWVVEGHRRLTVIQNQNPAKPVGERSDKPSLKTLSERLDEAADIEGISHEEQAHRIDISRTTYFDVKAGRGSKKSRRKTENYLANVFTKIGRRSGPKSD